MPEVTEQDFPELNEEDVDPNPFRQFGNWFALAESAVSILPNAMTLATVSEHGTPAARVVLLKEFDENGFVFYTNYDSRKGIELSANPAAALCFYWSVLGKQIRINGTVTRTSREESDAYFHTRPLDSQLGAWASNQSEVIESRDVLERRMEEAVKKYGEQIPTPEHWGGYRLAPTLFEFWQNRASRLHDRIRYRLDPQGMWIIERLAP